MTRPHTGPADGDPPPAETGPVGAPVSGGHGEPLGVVGAVYTDTETGRPVWAGVDGARGTAIVPLDAATFDGATVHLPFGADLLRTAPQHTPGAPLSLAAAAELSHHYGLDAGAPEPGLADDPLPATGPRPDSASVTRPDSASVTRPDSASVMTRSEEQLRVERHFVQVGRARLVTRLITEDVTFTIPLRRQEISLEYDPLPVAEQRPTSTAPAPDTYEVVRHEEQVHFTTHVVPVERVRLITRVVTTEHVLAEQVRHEEVHVDTGPGVIPDR